MRELLESILTGLLAMVCVAAMMTCAWLVVDVFKSGKGP